MTSQGLRFEMFATGMSVKQERLRTRHMHK